MPRPFLTLVAALGLITGGAAAAQMKGSPSNAFLDAVRKGDGTVVTKCWKTRRCCTC